MLGRYIAALGAERLTCRTLLPLVLMACLAAGCSVEPRPRSYMEFMDDSLAREGALARCNQDREATADDAECINARRAASTIAARADEALRDQREAESDILRAAVRDRAGYVQTAAERAEVAAQIAAEAEYEEQWRVAEENVEAAQLSYAEPAEPSLEFIELPASASPALPYVDLPASAQRREFVPEPELEEIALPAGVEYRD
ncbi:MAG: EexN family lipoprotein [Gammaproteobacteria bacterium]